MDTEERVEVKISADEFIENSLYTYVPKISKWLKDMVFMQEKFSKGKEMIQFDRIYK